MLRLRGPMGIAVAVLSIVATACGSTAAQPTVSHARPAAPYRYVAVGARDRDVLRSFLIEAGVMGAVGGLLGTLLGLALARAVGTIVDGYLRGQGLAGVHVGTPVVLGVATVIGSTLLALVAGSVPARRAARLSPREAVEQ